MILKENNEDKKHWEQKTKAFNNQEYSLHTVKKRLNQNNYAQNVEIQKIYWNAENMLKRQPYVVILCQDL